MSDTSKTAKNHKKMIGLLFNSTLRVRRCDGEWYHLLWFLLFSMCHSLHVAVNKCTVLYIYTDNVKRSRYCSAGDSACSYTLLESVICLSFLTHFFFCLNCSTDLDVKWRVGWAALSPRVFVVEPLR